MKINASDLVIDYVATIKGDRWNFGSIADALVLFVGPVIASIATYWIRSDIDQSIYLSFFTLFGVFIAVFMAIQGVLVPLYHTSRRSSKDVKVDDRLKKEYIDRIRLIREVSSTLSYLKLFSLLSMIIFMIPISTGSDLFLFKWISIGLTSHFLLNILVVLKRINALFKYEFEID